MGEINALEAQVTELEASGTDPEKLKALLENLGEARNQLSNLSNGCGHVRKPGG
jgi:hypothetical protein